VTSRAAPTDAEPVADWLGHLVDRRRRKGFAEPTPQHLADEAAARRADDDERIVALLAERLDPAVRDDEAARAFPRRYGPFAPEAAREAVDRLVAREGRDQHVRGYLDAIRRGGAA
jgi:hypothetical protein